MLSRLCWLGEKCQEYVSEGIISDHCFAILGSSFGKYVIPKGFCNFCTICHIFPSSAQSDDSQSASKKIYKILLHQL